MTALELFAILVLAGAVIILFYYYLKEMNRTGSAGINTFKSSVYSMKEGVSDAGTRVGEGISNQNFEDLKSNINDAGKKISDAGSSVSEGISQQYKSSSTDVESKNLGISERVYAMGDKLKGTVREVPLNTDAFSARIDEFLDDQSDRLIKDWELATKSDVGELEKKYSKVARDVDDLEKRFNEYRGYANKKFEHIEKRVTALESEESSK